MKAVEQPLCFPLACMPDGRPAPFLLTEQELIEFLRIDVRFPKDTVVRLRKRGLRALQVSKRVLFRLDDVLDFLKILQQDNPR